MRIKNIDYYSLHGIWGAYASLALGRLGKGAGMVVGNVQPPQRGLFAGYCQGSLTPRMLPFSPGINIGFERGFLSRRRYPRKTKKPKKPIVHGLKKMKLNVICPSAERNGGRLALLSRLYPFSAKFPIPRTRCIPLSDRICVRQSSFRLPLITSAGKEPMTGIFGLQGIKRPLSDSSNGSLTGFANGNEWGFASLSESGSDEVMDWSVLNAAFGADKPIRRLAAEGALRWKIAAGEKRTCLVALGAYRDGIVTSGLRAHSYYTILYKNLEEVLESALHEAESSLKRAAELDAILEAAPLSDDRKFFIAHSAHSYNASTELLLSENGKPLFIVNEGEYRMMNTLDLTVDQAFWELKWTPWTVKNELDFFLERSSYKDANGLAFAHDQGVADCFTPSGMSSYELPHLTDCFSYMSYEETLNWVLTACLYAYNANDEAWITARSDTITACLNSLLARDKNGDGIMDVDSDRCSGGSEITTYDSLDVSLGQARNNLYLAVKAWSAFVCLEALFLRIGGAGSPKAALANNAARLASATISSRVIPGEDFIPAVFESDNRSKIIPAVEGLVYPLFCGAAAAVSEKGPYASFIAVLKRHLDVVLAPGICLDKVSGGWKLSSTSKNTWLSKIFINQFVAENILGLKGERTERDAVHASWQREGSADWAITDQVDSSDGHDLGSRLYPRLVSSILWLFPPKPGK